MLTDPHAAKREKIEMCGTCRFFFPTPKAHKLGTGIGDCRRMPPSGTYEGQATTHSEGWCGEYKEDKFKIEHQKEKPQEK